MNTVVASTRKDGAGGMCIMFVVATNLHKAVQMLPHLHRKAAVPLVPQQVVGETQLWQPAQAWPPKEPTQNT